MRPKKAAAKARKIAAYQHEVAKINARLRRERELSDALWQEIRQIALRAIGIKAEWDELWREIRAIGAAAEQKTLDKPTSYHGMAW